MNNLNCAFPTATYPNLKFQPVLEAWQHEDSNTRPGHVDMHKQIRVVLSQVRINGIWFLGWYYLNHPDAQNAGWAKNNWAQANSRRWAEAIQNEPEAQTEGISAAIPASSEVVENDPDPFTHKLNGTGGTRIHYRLAQRASFQLRIYEKVNGDKGQLVRTINEGYTGTSPQGKFENGIDSLGTALNGTSAYWDGRDEQNNNVENGEYLCYLVINGDETGDPITMTKQAP